MNLLGQKMSEMGFLFRRGANNFEQRQQILILPLDVAQVSLVVHATEPLVDRTRRVISNIVPVAPFEDPNMKTISQYWPLDFPVQKVQRNDKRGDRRYTAVRGIVPQESPEPWERVKTIELTRKR